VCKRCDHVVSDWLHDGTKSFAIGRVEVEDRDSLRFVELLAYIYVEFTVLTQSMVVLSKKAAKCCMLVTCNILTTSC
jgi:hypothetical protein